MDKILITGGAGFIPSSLAGELLKKGYYVVLVDNLLTGSLDKIPKHANCKFIKCDVNRYEDIAPIMTSYRFDYVFRKVIIPNIKSMVFNETKVP